MFLSSFRRRRGSEEVSPQVRWRSQGEHTSSLFSSQSRREEHLAEGAQSRPPPQGSRHPHLLSSVPFPFVQTQALTSFPFCSSRRTGSSPSARSRTEPLNELSGEQKRSSFPLPLPDPSLGPLGLALHFPPLPSFPRIETYLLRFCSWGSLTGRGRRSMSKMYVLFSSLVGRSVVPLRRTTS